MTKVKSLFVCENCGATTPRWQGKCPTCHEWNTLAEDVVEDSAFTRAPLLPGAQPAPITDVALCPPERLDTGSEEFNRVLGGGIVQGSLVLLGGDPGIGKSTLMLQLSHHLAKTRGPVLYVSGEESFSQARLRADRLQALHDNLILFPETSVSAIARHVQAETYHAVIVDSIQSVYSAEIAAVPGSMSQVRECANEFLRLAKGQQTPVFLVGHVTKEGIIAGPRLLEHLVDTVLYFEGEGRQALRILRSIKNRFGSTNEIAVFEMHDSGLQEVANPSALFLNERPVGVSGSVVLPSVEGTRPLLVEVQALVGDVRVGSPRRTVTGLNPNRISLLLAVLEKRAGLHLSDRDVFVNVAGGFRLEEPAADMAAAIALVSSFKNVPAHPALAAFGEIGLAGEVRAVDMARQRVQEAAKFGFSRCLAPAGCAKDTRLGGSVLPVACLEDAVHVALEVQRD